MDADDRLEQLILRWQELHEAGRPVSARELCADCPELAETLRRSVRALAYWERFLGTGSVLAQSREETPGAFAPAFGKYRVVRRLGRGGQAATLLAFDPDLQRHVVLKVFHQAHTPQEQEVVLREGRALARVCSPYVAQCLAAERQDGVLYLVVEYVAGSGLAERHRERPLTPDQAAKCIGHLAEGLAAVHACGLLHRDLKPANVLVDGDGRPRLIDFGLAVPVASAGLAEVSGTLAYMPPEQARGEVERIDPRTDVYGLGAILYELLTGRPPHQGATRAELWGAACRGDVVPPRQVNPRVPAALEWICMKALAADPTDRHASSAALADDLRRYRARPRRLALAVAAVAGLLLLGVTAWLIVAKRPGGVALVAVTPTPSTELSAPSPLKGWIDVRVWEGKNVTGPRNPHRRGLFLHQLHALPLKVGDEIQVELSVNRPMFVYVVWINSAGKAMPVYPWREFEWDQRPAEEQPVEGLKKLPEGAVDDGWQMDQGVPGMETLLFLARRSKLPPQAETALKAALATVGPQPLQDGQTDAAVWFENGAVVTAETGRAPMAFDVQRIDDPVLRTQGVLRDKLGPHFDYTRAVSFAFWGSESRGGLRRGHHRDGSDAATGGGRGIRVARPPDGCR
jgi:serine/threonine protein kinase